MRWSDLESGQRAGEWFHGLTAPSGMWVVVRVDGRGFSRFTEERFDKPFDVRFSGLMVETAQALLTEFGARYAYTESDEISIVLDPRHDMFGRGVEKLVSVSAGVASAAFTHAAGEPAHFDSRVWIGAGPGDVLDYASWRQADATRCALNGWCYWTLRKAGASRREATGRLEGTTTAAKHELLLGHGTDFDDLPAWQRRGIGLWWEEHSRAGRDPVRGVDVTTTRRRVHVEHDLPVRDAYRALVHRLVTGSPELAGSPAAVAPPEVGAQEGAP
ncbi:tRNA(His) guanylyltransferase Thg1 family protein [Saccharothrix texasensis]|uniref:tRNA(His) guanylyltransferase n=1 Tax=Saccharothrix texasensis TaxID=103734 RepID=A0A3N1H3K5_9PSEU|nr:tRNA(His) guanylyltransferase Thg1 family protein [Saccharothrix texasensis]ROP37097.1 tRNA(His) 5'-end guanylyltransferase [Saccharothrix texasensis]